MKSTEAAALCRYTKACCPQQKFDEWTPDAWFDLLGDVPFDAAKRAVAEVAKRQPFVSPAEIRAEVSRAHRQLQIELGHITPPWQLADDAPAEQRWLKDYRSAIERGESEEQAKRRANAPFGITEEPLAIESGTADTVREEIKVMGEKMRLENIEKEAARNKARDERIARREAARVLEAERRKQLDEQDAAASE